MRWRTLNFSLADSVSRSGPAVSAGAQPASAAGCARELTEETGLVVTLTDLRVEMIDRQEVPESRQRLLGSRA